MPDPQPPADDDYGAWIGYADEVQEDPARSTRAEASAVGSVPSSDAVSPTRPDDVLKQFAIPPASRSESGSTPPPDPALDDTEPLRGDRAGTNADVTDTSETEDKAHVDNTAPGRVDESVPMWAGTGASQVARRQATPRGSAELAPAAKRTRQRSSARIPAEGRSRARARETRDRSDQLQVKRGLRLAILRPRGVPRAGWAVAAVVLLAVGIVALSLEGSSARTSSTPQSGARVEVSAPTLPDASHLTDGPTLLSALNVAAITQAGSRSVGESITRYEAARRAAARRAAAERARRHRQLLARRRAKARRAQQRQAAAATPSSGSASTYTPSTATSAASTESSAATTPTYTPSTPTYTAPTQTSDPATSSSPAQSAGPTGAGTQSGGCDPLCK